MSRIGKGCEKNNGMAYNLMGTFHLYAQYGRQRDPIKAGELFLKSGQFGSPDGYRNIGNLYKDGDLPRDDKKAKYYYELASIKGNCDARYELADMEIKAGNVSRGWKHHLIAAKSGYDLALGRLKDGYTKGHITKDEYAEAMRAYKESVDEMNSDERIEAAKTVPSTMAGRDCIIS